MKGQDLHLHTHRGLGGHRQRAMTAGRRRTGIAQESSPATATTSQGILTAGSGTCAVAGTAHADAYVIGKAASLLGCGAVNDGPQHSVVQAALVAFSVWVTSGTAPAAQSP